MLPERASLLYWDCEAEYGVQASPFGYPLEVAAMKGNVEITRLLLEHVIHEITSREDRIHIYASVAWHAVRGDQISTLEIGLEDERVKTQPYFVYILHSSISLTIFKRLLDLWRTTESSTSLSAWERLTAQTETQILRAAIVGDIPQIDYLIGQGLSLSRIFRLYQDIDDLYPSVASIYHPIELAAMRGRYDAVVYLLGKGATVTPKSILSAAKFRSHRLLRLLLEHSTSDRKTLDIALEYALNRENDSVVALLREYGAMLVDWEKGKAMGDAEYKGQETMANIISGFQ